MNFEQFDHHARTVLTDARRRSLLRHRPIGSDSILAALADSAEIAALLDSCGIETERIIDRLGTTPPSADQVLGDLGVDVSAIRSTLAHSWRAANLWRLHRSTLRPLRVTLDTPSTSTAFDASGRKVLEVALWNGRRRHRPANAPDLLRGVLADGRDPTSHLLTMSGPGPFRRLRADLEMLDLQSA